MQFKNAILSKSEIEARGHQARTNYTGRAYTIMIGSYIRGYKATKWPATVGHDYASEEEGIAGLLNRALEGLKTAPKGSSVIVSDNISNYLFEGIRIPEGIYVKFPPFKKWEEMHLQEQMRFAVTRRCKTLADAKNVCDWEESELSEGGVLPKWSLVMDPSKVDLCDPF